MPPVPSTSNQGTLIIKIVVAIGVVAGISFVAYQIGYGNGVGTKDVSQTESTLPIESRLVIGTVEKISSQKITIKDFRKIPIVASSTDQSARMTVVANVTTIIERLIQKDIAVINKERDAFLKEIEAQGAYSSTTAMIQPPTPYTLTKITLSDIKVGDTVSAFAAEDISKLTTFTATKIDIQNASSVPTTVPGAQ